MERRVNKKKLSRNLLDMKFMKRTREKTEIQDEEEMRSQLFDSEVTPAMRVGGSRIVCEPSYVPIENLTFGRLAFKGMNAEIESMMAAAQASAEEGVEEADVSQEEMAGRLSQNMAKKYGSKRDSGGKPTINKDRAQVDASLLALAGQASSFLSAARAESDLAKKSKTDGFLKPQDDD